MATRSVDDAFASVRRSRRRRVVVIVVVAAVSVAMLVWIGFAVLGTASSKNCARPGREDSNGQQYSVNRDCKFVDQNGDTLPGE